MRTRLMAVSVLCLLCFAGSAAAQEAGQAGITMGYPASIGVMWHVSERVAVRPELSLTVTGSSTSGQGSSDTDSWVLGTGVSVLFYMRKADSLSTYLAPRFTYTRNESNGFTDAGGTSYAIAGLFGAQYSLSPRFSVFGEVGLGFSRQESTATTGQTDFTSRSHALSTRTGVGVVLYLK